MIPVGLILKIAGIIIAALSVGALIYLTVKLSISFLKKYRQKKGTKILAAKVKDIIKNAPTKKLDDLPDEEDVIIAEYDDEEDKLVQDITVARDIDIRVEEILESNGGIVVFE